jgi:RNA polymerase sigma factor (sigma-70 family)
VNLKQSLFKTKLQNYGETEDVSRYLKAFSRYPVLRTKKAFLETFIPFERVHKRVIARERNIDKLKEALKGASEAEECFRLQREIAACWKELRPLLLERDRLADPLICGNIRFVAMVASQYGGLGVPIVELIQEGALGLMPALYKFEKERGYSFATYASWWVRNQMQRYLAENGFGNVVRVPQTQIQRTRALQNALTKFKALHGREPSDQELHQFLSSGARVGTKLAGLGIKQLARLRQSPFLGKTYSLQKKTKNGQSETQTHEDFLASEALTPEQKLRAKEALDEHRRKLRAIDEYLERNCSERDRRFFRGRNGLDGEPLTLNTLAVEFNISRERVRQVVARITKELGLTKYEASHLVRGIAVLEELLQD